MPHGNHGEVPGEGGIEMKKGMIFLCFIVCLLVGVGISNATSLIENGGFERKSYRLDNHSDMWRLDRNGGASRPMMVVIIWRYFN